ncbi:lipopolysaccharide biosynthesis protein [Pacificimonas sp. WHA3]|uniref:Lipopolysaccharide biosynthesis protein n=1 Tax=Pacificimonas pallii TaxID=2827236 RepID=A0ABS6SGM4_9SPHN|nr:lipopolysaccharide biosynthesis protein [Pacificimonas pallii]MBV7257570.1 lipopolysaccharide biosynthesis protein [Pacificimonas pallii]
MATLAKDRIERVKFSSFSPLAQALIRNAAAVFSGNMIAGVLGLLSVVAAARTLEPDLFGVLILIVTYVTVVDRLLNFQSWTALVRFGTAARERNDVEELRTVVKLCFFADVSTAAAGALVAVGLAPLVAGQFGWSDSDIVLVQIYALVIVTNIVGVTTGLLQLERNFGLLAKLNVLAAALKAIASIIGFAADFGFSYFVLSWLVADLIKNGTLIWVGIRLIRRLNLAQFLRSSSRDVDGGRWRMLKFLFVTNLVTSLKMAIRELDVLVVGAILDPRGAGIYKVAKQFGSTLSRPIDPVNVVIYPEFASLSAAGADTRFWRLFLKITLMTFLAATLMLIVLYAAAVPLITYTVGADYLSAVPVFILYAVGVHIAISTIAFYPALTAMGYEERSLAAIAIAAAIYFAALYLLTVQYGLVGAGAAHIVFYLVWGFMMSLSLRAAKVRGRR